MKNFFLILTLLVFSSAILSQELKLSKKELALKLDSVLEEGNLLYKYEKSAWVSTDLVRENPSVKRNFHGYFTYEINSMIKTIILDKDHQNCIAEYTFTADFNKPFVSLEKRKINLIEEKLLDIRNKITDQLYDEKYNISIPDGYNPNMILLPFNDKYKLYLIMGTSQSDVIPFGNDYLFVSDSNGTIESWQKFHSQLIPMNTEINGGKVTKITHSHLRTSPLITATDICTFMLYAPLYGLEEFDVYSPALSMYMVYNLKENKITTKKSKY